MKFTITCCLFAAMFAASAAAQTATDSLLAILPQQSDTVKLNSISKLIDMSYGQAVRKNYIDLLLDEAHKAGHIGAEGRALALLVEWYYPQFDNDSVFIAGKKAEDFTRRHQLHSFLFTVQQTLIQRYADQHQFLTALRKADEAYAEAKSIGYDMAVARMLSAIANIYGAMKQPAEAFKYYKESLDYTYKADNTRSFLIIENYINLAAASLNLKDYETAIAYADSMVRHPKGGRAPYPYLAAYFKADANARLNRPAEAMKYIREAEAQYSPEFGENFGVYLDYARRDYYRSVRDYAKAIEYTDKIMQFCLPNGLLDAGYMDELKNKAEILAEMGNGKEAVGYFREVLQLNDSLNTQQFYSQINELRTIYELDKSELKAEQHRMAKERNRNYFLFALGGCLLLSVITTLVILNRRKIALKNRGLVRQIKEQDRLAEELEQLRKRYKSLAQSAPQAVEKDCAELPGDSEQRQLVARMREYLLADRLFTDSGIDRDKLVAALGTNKTYLFEAVGKVAGKTPLEYVNDMRLDETRRMLDNCPELTAEAIATDCGFSTRTFYRLFRERYQISPLEYRRIARERT